MHGGNYTICIIVFFSFLLACPFLSRYGFRGMPLLFVSARPKLGDRQVKLTHVTDWIEKKLKQEFKVQALTVAAMPRIHLC